MTGWTCPSCGVNYAPSVTQCRCSAVDAEKEKDAKRLRKILDDWQKNQPPVTPAPPFFVPVEPWIDPWQCYRRYCGDVVATTPIVDTVNVDYLQLASLGGRQ